jgi:hypothetical protein
MVKIIDKKTYENMKYGVKDGMGTALKQAKRIEWRTPWVYHKPAASKTWILGITLAVVAIIGGILYFRKRKQVADRYTMGEKDAANGFDPSESRDEILATTSPGIN